MESGISDIERKLLGALAFVVCAAPVLVLLGLAVAIAAHVTVPGWLKLGGGILFLLGMALQVPLLIMFAGAVPDAKDDEGLLRGKFAHPFALFEFWWRHIRVRSRRDA